MEEVNENYFKWTNYTEFVSNACKLTYESDALTDVTIVAQNKKIQAHQIVLSASSTYLQSILNEVSEAIHPVIILSDIEYEDLEVVIKFMYSGEVAIRTERFNLVLEVAQCLQIKGLLEVKNVLENFDKSSHGLETEDLTIVDDKSDEPEIISDTKLLKMLCLDEVQDNTGYMVEHLPCMTFELMEEDLKCHIAEEFEDATVINPAKKPFQNFKQTSAKLNQRSQERKSKCSFYKNYNLKAAIEDLKKGTKLSEAASTHSIPKSTLYLHARSSGATASQRRRRDRHSEKQLNEAIQAVQDGYSLKKAGDKFNIPKTVLWRRIQKKFGGGFLPNNSNQKKGIKDPRVKEKVWKALTEGQTISMVAKKFEVPLSTVFRQKRFLITQGTLRPKSNPAKNRGKSLSLKKAVSAVLSGETVVQAAFKFNVAKGTLYRHVKKLKTNGLTV